MYPLIQAAITTFLIYLISSRTNFHTRNSTYITIFLLLTGLGYFFNNRIYADEISWPYHIQKCGYFQSKYDHSPVLIEVKGPKKNSLRKRFEESYQYHYKMCDEC